MKRTILLLVALDSFILTLIILHRYEIQLAEVILIIIRSIRHFIKNLVITLDGSILRINQSLENQLNTHCMLRDIFMYNFLLTVRQRKLQERIS